MKTPVFRRWRHEKHVISLIEFSSNTIIAFSNKSDVALSPPLPAPATLALVTCFPALGKGSIFSRPASRFPALGTGLIFSYAWRWLIAFPALATGFMFSTTSTGYIFLFCVLIGPFNYFYLRWLASGDDIGLVFQ